MLLGTGLLKVFTGALPEEASGPTIAPHTSGGCDLAVVERDRLYGGSADHGHARGRSQSDRHQQLRGQPGCDENRQSYHECVCLPVHHHARYEDGNDLSSDAS